jgi:hypothetical protein
MRSLPDTVGNLGHDDQSQNVWDTDDDPEEDQDVSGGVDHAAGVFAVTASAIFWVLASSFAMTSAIFAGSAWASLSC